MKLSCLLVLLFSLNSFAQENSIPPAETSSEVNSSTLVLPTVQVTTEPPATEDDDDAPVANPVAVEALPLAPVATSVVVVPAAVKPFPQFEFKSYGYINVG